MRYKEFERMFKRFLPELPGFCVDRYLLYKCPIGHILRGFCGEGSGFSKSRFTLYIFAMPLYKPSDCVHFAFGDRIGWELRRERWFEKEDVTAPQQILEWIKSYGLAFLEGADTPEQFADWVIVCRNKIGMGLDCHCLEAIFYSLVLAGDYPRASEYFEMLLAESKDFSRDWEYELLRRAERVRDALNRSPDEAKALLAEWEQFTIASLKLRDCVP